MQSSSQSELYLRFWVLIMQYRWEASSLGNYGSRSAKLPTTRAPKRCHDWTTIEACWWSCMHLDMRCINNSIYQPTHRYSFPQTSKHSTVQIRTIPGYYTEYIPYCTHMYFVSQIRPTTRKQQRDVHCNCTNTRKSTSVSPIPPYLPTYPPPIFISPTSQPQLPNSNPITTAECRIRLRE